MRRMYAMRTLVLTATVVCFALPSWSEQPSVAASSSERASTIASSTIQTLVDDISGQVSHLIEDFPRPQMDVAVVIHGTLPQRQGSENRLDQELRQLLLGSLIHREPLRSVSRPRGSGWSDSMSARRAAATQGFELLLWLEVSLSNNHLILEGTLFETERHLWRETVSPERQIVGRLFVRARVDAELRRYLPPLPTAPLSAVPYPLGNDRILGLAVADLDGDDLTEIVLLSTRALELRRLGQGKAPVVTKLGLTGSPRSATRSRDPVGSLVIGPPGDDGLRPIAFRTSDYSQGMIVRFDGAEMHLGETLSDYPILWEAELECSTVTPGRSEFMTATTSCSSFQEASMVDPFYALARVQLQQPTGSAVVVSATALASGSVLLTWNAENVPSVSSYGTALAITDINDDGEAEVLLSSDRDPGTGDELTILSIGQDGVREAQERLTDIPGSIWVATAGDVDNDGLHEFLAIAQTATGAQLLVVE